MITVYTALYGGYDRLRAAPEVPGVAFVAFTDDRLICAPGWDVRIIERPPGEHPRMSAKWFKCLPHRALHRADETLWIDASHEIIGFDGIHGALECARSAGIAAHHHPRGCIYVEAKASTAFEKYDGQPVIAQVDAYRLEGHPEDWGLWACGSIARIRSDALDAAMEDWWDENAAWSYQDQLSLPVVMRRAGMRPATFPHPQYQSPWFAIHPHLRDD